MLPEWIAAPGRLTGIHEVDGITVRQARGRHCWENGDFVEIEISDFGDEAGSEMAKSLGVDLGLENGDNEANFTLTYESFQEILDRDLPRELLTQ